MSPPIECRLPFTLVTGHDLGVIAANPALREAPCLAKPYGHGELRVALALLTAVVAATRAADVLA